MTEPRFHSRDNVQPFIPPYHFILPTAISSTRVTILYRLGVCAFIFSETGPGRVGAASPGPRGSGRRGVEPARLRVLLIMLVQGHRPREGQSGGTAAGPVAVVARSR